jgi:protein SCO1
MLSKIKLLFVSGLIFASFSLAVAQQKASCCDDKPVANEAVKKKSGEKTISSADIPDIEAIDQNGDKLHFYSDLVRGKTVIINFVYTTCTNVCPLQGKAFAKIQEEFGDRLGNDVFLISVSLDPENDTPKKLKDWGEKYGAKYGWTFVTGKKDEMNKLLKMMTGDVAGSQLKHSPILFVGDDNANRWVRMYGLAEPDRVRSVVNISKQTPVVDEKGTETEQ